MPELVEVRPDPDVPDFREVWVGGFCVLDGAQVLEAEGLAQLLRKAIASIVAQAEEREKRLRRVVNMVRVVDRPNTGARDHRFVALYIREKVCLLAGKGLASLLSEADVNEVAEALAACGPAQEGEKA